VDNPAPWLFDGPSNTPTPIFARKSIIRAVAGTEPGQTKPSGGVWSWERGWIRAHKTIAGNPEGVSPSLGLRE